MNLFIYLILLFHTVATFVIGYIMCELDGKEEENKESKYFMIAVMSIELIATLSIITLVIDRWGS